MLRPHCFQYVTLSLVVALAVLAPGSSAGGAQTSPADLATPPAAIAAAKGSADLSCKLPVPFRRAEFSRSTRINNKFLPLRPGTQFTLQGTTNTGAHTVILTVTDLIKVVDGVRTVVLWDRDIQDGVLAEAELAFHAQADNGNVWSLGEYPEQYDNGVFVGAPKTWISGLDQAQGGIAMLGKPRLGTPSYLQGFSPSIDFLDCGRVLANHQRVCVPVRCFGHVLVIDETSPLASATAHQQKFYAPGVGNVEIRSGRGESHPSAPRSEPDVHN